MNKKFKRNSEKQYIKKFRFYPDFMFKYLDKWLKAMSKAGWHIVHSGMFSFLFEKGEPKEKEYFTYSEFTQEGKYSIMLRHPYLEETYGKAKSALNANESRAYRTVEIDTEKVDVQSDTGYRELLDDRNRLTLRYFVRNISIALIVITSIAVLNILF